MTCCAYLINKKTKVTESSAGTDLPLTRLSVNHPCTSQHEANLHKSTAMDDAFVQAIEYRPVSPIPQATGIPVIDLSPLARTPPSPGAVNALAAGVGAACRDWGFFLAVSHGVPDATVARAVEAGRAFFALPPERKAAVRRTEQAPLGYYDAEHTKNVRDWKEVFDVFPHEPRPHAGAADDELVFVNKWPDDGELPEFR